MPAVSIIIACLNGAKTIGKAVRSVQDQTFQDFEVIVVDDGSTDGTYELVKSLSEQDARIVPLKLPHNMGPGAARNEGFKQAKGTWIGILDADDWIEPPRLEAMVKAGRETGADLVNDNMKFYDHVLGRIIDQTSFGAKNKIAPLTTADAFRLDDPFRRASIGYLQPIIRKDFLEKHHISYNTAHRVGEDFMLLADILLSGAKAVIIPEAYYVYVHMVSPTTRQKAPQSKTKRGEDSIIRASDEILAKYGPSMNEVERRALLARKSKFITLFAGREMQSDFHNGEPLKALGQIVKRPQILFLIGVSLCKMLVARVRGFFAKA